MNTDLVINNNATIWGYQNSQSIQPRIQTLSSTMQPFGDTRIAKQYSYEYRPCSQPTKSFATACQIQTDTHILVLAFVRKPLPEWNTGQSR
jgi:hypothetical protein